MPTYTSNVSNHLAHNTIVSSVKVGRRNVRARNVLVREQVASLPPLVPPIGIMLSDEVVLSTLREALNGPQYFATPNTPTM